MSPETKIQPNSPAPSAATATRAPLMARAVLSRLERIESGSLTLVYRGTTHVFGDELLGWPPASLEVHDDRFFGWVKNGVRLAHRRAAWM